MLYLCLSHFFPGLQSTALATKDEHEASEVLNLPGGLIIMSQIKNADRFTHWEFRPFENVVQSLPNTARATQSDLQNHLSF